jgi:hypothetical protein
MVGISFFPAKADPVSIVDSQTMLAPAISGEPFQTIARRNAQIGETLGRVQGDQAAQSGIGQMSQAFHKATIEQPPRVRIAERPNHDSSIAGYTGYVKRKTDAAQAPAAAVRRVGKSEWWQKLSQAIQELLPILGTQPANAAYDQAVIQGEELRADDARHLQSGGLMVDANIQQPRLIAGVGDHGHEGVALRIEIAPAEHRGRALHALIGIGERKWHNDDLERITDYRNSRGR